MVRQLTSVLIVMLIAGAGSVWAQQAAPAAPVETRIAPPPAPTPAPAPAPTPPAAPAADPAAPGATAVPPAATPAPAAAAAPAPEPPPAPTPRQLAEKLVACLGLERSVAAYAEQVKAQIRRAPRLGGGVGEAGAAQAAEVEGMVDRELNWGSCREEYVALYVEAFSGEELAGLVAFYETPVGKRLVEKQPELTQRGARVCQARMMGLLPKLQGLAGTPPKPPEKPAP